MEGINSHNLIEYFMIETNKVVGKKLYKHYGEKAIYRKHDKTDVNIEFIDDEELKDFLKLRSMKKATYSYCNKDDKNYHYGLDS